MIATKTAPPKSATKPKKVPPTKTPTSRKSTTATVAPYINDPANGQQIQKLRDSLYTQLTRSKVRAGLPKVNMVGCKIIREKALQLAEILIHNMCIATMNGKRSTVSLDDLITAYSMCGVQFYGVAAFEASVKSKKPKSSANKKEEEGSTDIAEETTPAAPAPAVEAEEEGKPAAQTATRARRHSRTKRSVYDRFVRRVCKMAGLPRLLNTSRIVTFKSFMKALVLETLRFSTKDNKPKKPQVSKGASLGLQFVCDAFIINVMMKFREKQVLMGNPIVSLQCPERTEAIINSIIADMPEGKFFGLVDRKDFDTDIRKLVCTQMLGQVAKKVPKLPHPAPVVEAASAAPVKRKAVKVSATAAPPKAKKLKRVHA